MAEHHPGDHRLIEEYLTGLRRSLHSRSDADAIVDELRDHLLAASEHHREAGVGADEADRLAVAEIGEPDVVAASFRDGDRGAPAVPTAFTRAAGVTGCAAGAIGLFAGVAFAIGDRVEDIDGYWSPESQAWGMVGSIATLLATLGLLTLLAGLVRRHGGLGAAGTIAIGVAVLGSLVSVIAWAIPVWGTLVAASWIVLAVASRGQGLAPRHATTALAAGLAVIPVAAAAGSTVPVFALGVAGLVVAAGSAVVLGRWLVSETEVVAARAPITAG